MAIPLVGGSVPAINYRDLVTGNSNHFQSGIGSWVAVGGTLTYDNVSGFTYSWPTNWSYSLKHVTTATGQYVELPITGTFKVGVEYVALVALTYEENVACDTTCEFGLIGTDVADYNVPSFGPDEAWNGGHYVVIALRWVPTATRTGVTVRITRTEAAGTLTLHVGHCKAFRSGPTNMAPIIATPGNSVGQGASGLTLLLNNGTQGVRVSVGGGEGGITFDASNGVTLDSNPAGGLYAAMGVQTGGGLYDPIWMQGETLSASDLVDVGVQMAAGPNYVGMRLSEKDSDTVQLYADVAGGYMMQLRNRGSGKGWAVSDDGTVNAKIAAAFQHILTVPGALTTGTDKAAHFQMPDKALIDEVRCHVGTQPVGASVIVDVNDDGTTIFTTQGNRPEIADSTSDDTSGVADGGTAVAKDSVITVDIDQIGSGTAGSDLTVFVRGRYIW